VESTSLAESLKNKIPKYFFGFFCINNTIYSIQSVSWDYLEWDEGEKE
jgi:hypothetical protein